jgi:hypothetical protein
MGEGKVSLTSYFWPGRMTLRERVLNAVLSQLTGVLEPVGITELPLATKVISSPWRYSVNNCPMASRSEPL